jgi:hypothetical protein
MKDVWRELFDAAKDNNVVQVTLAPGHRVEQPKRSRCGRPRTIGPVRFGHYAAYDETTGGRPRCALPGCSRYLKRSQPVACCADHEEKVVAWAKRILARVVLAVREAA